MAHSSAVNRPGYQTYAVPLPGGKRKRAAANSQSESAEHNATPMAARSKRSRPNQDEYNAKYMAEMCFSAYKARLHMAGYTQYTADVANEWREDLVEMFSHAALKGTIKQNAAARHVVPRLTTLIPRRNEKKDELAKDFAKHYETVRNDMMVIDRVMGNGFKVDERSIIEVRECINGLHYFLAKGEQWRNVMPYTPLPIYRLRALRDLIKYSRPHHLLGDLVTNVEDMEGWLSPPPASFAFPTGSIDETMDTLQKVTEDKIAKTSIGPYAQQMADYRAQKAEVLRLQKEEQVRQQEKERLEEVQRGQAEREQLKQRIKSLETTAAEERAQESMKKAVEAAATAQREKSYRNQIVQNATEINRLKPDLANLAAKQGTQDKPEATSKSSPPVVSGQIGTSISSSFSSNQTANNGSFQPQSSLGTSFGSSMNGGSYGQPGSFDQTSHHPTPKDDDVQMTDARGFDSSQQDPRSFGPVGSSAYSIRGVGQSNLFNAGITNGALSHPLGISADDGNFKAACPAYKNGTCTLGRSCKLPHTACRFWLKDIINHIQAIQQNWFIHPSTSEEPILPPSLLAGVPINCLPAAIIEAIHELSTLTICQRDRAHNLLNTYFQARIREGSYSGKSQKIFAILEIGDVKKACESLRRMSRGREMQGPVPVKEDETRKRKYSIRHEMNAVTEEEEDEDAQRLAKRLQEELCVISEDDNTKNEPSISVCLNSEDIPTPPDSKATIITATLPSMTTTPQTQRRNRPPPIVITEITTPTATSPGIVPPFSSFTPLFNSLAQEFGGDPDTPCPMRQNTYQPQLQQSQPDLLNITDNSYGDDKLISNDDANGNGNLFESP
ncbi:hypothetical protein J4E91_004999 [Alternaria rosae]|nr:hypothetical protein J4E91_004999 [Alternaria rosae]